jgi:NAD(P)-dependent dehydrogenase (short-subunit alcohol dehydrogenase family)
MDLGLNDLVAIVTGASKGIGLAITRMLLAEGAQVVAASRKSSNGLAELAGPNLLHVPVDLVEPEGPGHVVTSAADVFGGLDILVNNAGGLTHDALRSRGSFLDATDADWRATFEFNLFSAVRATRAAIPLMLERGGGTIINISSANGRSPLASHPDYGAAKAGMNNLTKALSMEFGPRGIRANTVSPGPVLTEWWTEAGGAIDWIAAQTGSTRQSVADGVAPQMFGLATGHMADAQEIARVVALLASPLSVNTTGADLVVDSGFLKSI